MTGLNQPAAELAHDGIALPGGDDCHAQGAGAGPPAVFCPGRETSFVEFGSDQNTLAKYAVSS
jgi:hypothetical protein